MTNSQYHLKIANRKARYIELAKKASTKSDQLYLTGRDALSSIPFGQPIITDHHSTASDFSFRRKAEKKISKSLVEHKKAKFYSAKAEAVGKAGISSDDPEAIEKLKLKLENLEKEIETKKTINKHLKNNNIQGFFDLGFNQENIEKLQKPDYMGRVGFPPFVFSCLRGKINQVKKRIENLVKPIPFSSTKGTGWSLFHDTEINRIKFVFDLKPDEEKREILKNHGFRWSPQQSAWQRPITQNAALAAQRIVEKLQTKS